MNTSTLRSWLVALMGSVFSVVFSVGSGVAYADEAAQIVITSDPYRTPFVELYTSEGCSSCPPADDFLRQLGQSLNQDFNAVPLAFHVDYWNYLGWEDEYSKPAFTTRQRQIATNNRHGVYTPQFIVDGREVRGGGRIVQRIQTANSQKAEADIVARIVATDSTSLHAQLEVNNHAQPSNAYLAVFENGITRDIAAGENRGKTLKHDFVVRHWSKAIAISNGLNHTDMQIDIPTDWQRRNLGLAVLVLERDSGTTVQSVQASLAPLFTD